MIKNENNLSPLLHLQCQCDEERDCNHYTFNADVKLCSLFATCDSYFDCPACVTGDEQCWQELGGDCSLSPTPPTPEKLVMIIGGDTGRYEMRWTDDIELVSLDSSPIPECLSSLNPFPFGTIYGSVGAALDGIPLICGGCIGECTPGTCSCSPSTTCYKYDPIADTWVETATMSTYRIYDATDFTESFGLAMANAETPLEVTQDGFNFELLADYPNPDVTGGPNDGGCLVILDDKNVLLAGGYVECTSSPNGCVGYGNASSRAFIYNRDDNQWAEVGSMGEGRMYHSCGLIPSGDGSGYEVIAVGGNGGGETPNENVRTSTEIFNLETSTWRRGINTSK